LWQLKNDPEAANLQLFLAEKDQFTFFAPTDDAFEALYDLAGVTDFNALVARWHSYVEAVLKYHVLERESFQQIYLT
jgi:uncharacterized surface protein with fasciclin (FAS1) repeats